MTPEAARASLQRQLALHGETVTVKRGAATYAIRARVRGYTAQEMLSGLLQGQRKVILSGEELEASGITLPLLPRQDRILARGGNWTITSADDSTRRINGVLIGVDCEVTG